MASLSRSNGVTFIELLAVLSIMSILGLLSSSAWHRFVLRHEVDALAQKYAHAIRMARESAVVHRTITTLCPIGPGAACGVDWQQGAKVFLDLNGNRVEDTEDRLLLRVDALPDTYFMQWRSWQGGPYIQFAPTGITWSHNGSLLICPRTLDARLGRVLILNKPGRVRFGRDSNGDGIPERANGHPLVCQLP